MNPVSRLLNRLEKLPRRGKFYTVVAIQFIILFAVIFSQWMVSWTGEQIILKTEPVDPRDFFHGDYVILSYDINTLDRNLLVDGPENKDEDESYIERNTSIYVVLEKEGHYHQPVAVYFHKPDLAPGQKLIRGRVQSGFIFENQLRITYGIERYYVEEDQGLEIEEIRENLDVAVLVTSSGAARVNHLLVDGERLKY